LRRLQPLHQPLAAEVGYGRHKDEHFRHHDENDGEQKKLRRKPRHIAGHAFFGRHLARRLIVQRQRSRMAFGLMGREGEL
jgi:hypothetical protein